MSAASCETVGRAPGVDETAIALADEVTRLRSGPLAALRKGRMKPTDPILEDLAARFPATVGARPQQWLAFLQIITELTPREEDPRSIHNPKRALGAVLCGASGSADADEAARRDSRVTRLLATPFARRGEGLRRIFAVIRSEYDADPGVNVCDIAWFLLDGNRDTQPMRIARAYSARRHAANQSKKKTSSRKA